MDEGIQLSSKLQSFKKAPDSSQQVFSILDDISATFKKELESAQSKEASKAISASPVQKESAKTGKKAETDKESVEKAEEAPPEGQLSINVSFDESEQIEANVIEEEEGPAEVAATVITSTELPITEETREEIPEERSELPVTGPVQAEQEQSSEHPVSQAPVESTPVQELPTALETPSEIAVAIEPAVSEDVTPIQIVETEETVVEVPDEVTKEIPAAPQAQAPTETLAPEELVNQVEKVSVQEVAVAEVSTEEETSQRAGEVLKPESSQERPNLQAGQAAEVRQIMPRKQAQEVEPQVAATEDKEETSSAKESEEVPEDFHSLTSSESIVIQLDAEESAQILKGLQDLSQQTQVQAPNLTKVSEQVIESLKASQSTLIQQEGGGRSSGPELNAIARGAGVQLADEEVESQPATPRFRDPKLEELKNKIVQQVRVKMKMNLKGQGGELRLQLHPKYLGKVKVRIVLEASTAKANFIVENETVREMLQRSLGSLENSLSDQGIDVSSIEISVAQDGGAQGDGSGGFHSVEDQEAVRDFIASFRRFNEEEVEEESSSGTTAEDTDGVLNIMA